MILKCFFYLQTHVRNFYQQAYEISMLASAGSLNKLFPKSILKSIGAAMTTTAASEDDHFYYFAFGSNLLRERVSINSPTAVFVTVAKLEGMV